MKVMNVHYRDLPAPPGVIGQFLDRLASESDALWPRDQWPAMRFDRPLQAGAVGGHGPIRYTVESYAPGQAIVFRFTGPKGFIGVHGFAVQEVPTGSRLTHTLSMDTRGSGTVLWLLASRPLHDALIEDALDNAAQRVGAPRQAPPWPVRVRVLRAVLQAIRHRKGAT